MKDYYKFLGIKPSASHDDVRVAYKKYAKYFLNKETLDDKDKIYIQKIKQAYSILSDYHKRRQYDNIREGLVNSNQRRFDNISIRTFEPVKQNFLKPFLDINFNDNPDKILKNLDLSKNNNYYVQSFQSTAKSNKSGGFDIEEKKYINNNGKKSTKSKKYSTNKKNLFIEQ